MSTSTEIQDQDQDQRLVDLSARLGRLLQALGWRITSAESCTGGGVAAAITAVSGSSRWFEYGLVTYANEAKQHLLGVDSKSLAEDGAVSETVVRQMIDGVLALSGAEVAVAVSGIAGPDGGSTEKPVGTVWFAWGTASGERVAGCHHFKGDRNAIQQQAVIQALRGVVEILAAIDKKTE